MSLKDKILAKFGPEPVLGEDEVGTSVFATALTNMRLYEEDSEVSFIPLPQDAIIRGLDAGLASTGGRLAIGSVGAALHEDNLSAAGITHILNLSQQVRNMFPAKFKYLKISHMKDDGSKESTNALNRCLDECLDFIRGAMQGGGHCLVHCYQGKSRSAAICCAYMLKYFGKDYSTMNEALDVIRLVRPQASPALNFVPVLTKIAKAGTIETEKIETSKLGSSESTSKLQVNRI